MTAFGTFFHGTLSRMERACLRSFVRHGHSVRLYAYAEMAVPDGVMLCDAEEILPAHWLYHADRGLHAGTVAQFSDHFRYAMIRQTGLVWIDTDIICLRPDWPDRPWLIARQDACLVNGAVLGIPQDHAMLDDALMVAERMHGVTVWGVIGPHLLTALAWEHGSWQHLLPTDSFYPLHCSRAAQLLRPMETGEQFTIPQESLCLHLWNEMLRMAGHDRLADPPASSALARLMDYAEAL